MFLSFWRFPVEGSPEAFVYFVYSSVNDWDTWREKIEQENESFYVVFYKHEINSEILACNYFARITQVPNVRKDFYGT